MTSTESAKRTTPPKGDGSTLRELVDVMQRLLGPGGCPWDREQTLTSLRPFLLEETYEVLEAMEHGSAEEHCDELGDLLMQIVFQAELRRAEGAFHIGDVVKAIVDKLVRRHPHVFADSDADTADEVLTQWEAIKAAERGEKRGSSDGPDRLLSGIPAALPALSRAQKLSSRAARVGFDWPDVAGCRAKVDEELGELDRALLADDRAAAEAEVGDLLFATVSLARKLGFDAELALRAASAKFEKRFEYVEDRVRQSEKPWQDASLEEMDGYWNEAKKVTVRDR